MYPAQSCYSVLDTFIITLLFKIFLNRTQNSIISKIILLDLFKDWNIKLSRGNDSSDPVTEVGNPTEIGIPSIVTTGVVEHRTN